MERFRSLMNAKYLQKKMRRMILMKMEGTADSREFIEDIYSRRIAFAGIHDGFTGKPRTDYGNVPEARTKGFSADFKPEMPLAMSMKMIDLLQINGCLLSIRMSMK